MVGMKYRFCIFWLCCLFIISGLFFNLEAQIEMYDVYEIEFEGQSFTNPYLENRVYAAVDGPGDELYNIEVFWKGGTTYALRVAPRAAGTYNWELFSPTDSFLDGLTGSFQCDSSDHRGFLTTNGQRFEYTSGEPVFRMGDTNWRMFRSKNAAYESLFVPYVDARASQGFNYVTGVVHTVADPSINEGGRLWVDGNLDQLNPDYFEWVDKRVQYLNSNGITVGMLFVWAQTFNDFTRDQFTRFRRYVVGRYAAYDVVWVISGEYTERETWEDYWPPEYGYHAECIKNGSSNDSGDPYGHPISIHPGGDQSNTQHYDQFESWLSFAMQQHDGSPDLLYDIITADRSYGIPVANDEYGYEGPTVEGQEYYHPSNQNADNIRRDSWTIIMAGGQLTYGHINTCTAKERSIILDSLYTDGALYLKSMKSFFTDSIPYFELQPDSDFIVNSAGYGMSKPDSFYMVYCPDSSSLEINISSSYPLYAARWYDPKADTSVCAGVINSNTDYQLPTPFPNDAVLVLEVIPPPVARFRLYLEGPFDKTKDRMHSLLIQQGHVSDTSPYLQDPRQVNAVPDSAVDWVLLELLDAPMGTSLFSKSFLLSKNGFLMSETNNSSYIHLSGVAYGDYYLKIHHRNHMPAISADSVTISENSVAEYDFTLGFSQYYEQECVKQLLSGHWAVKGGDINRDDLIDGTDFNLWYVSAQDAETGYMHADINMDGVVNTMDYIFIHNN